MNASDDVATLMNAALKHHAQGRQGEAETLYRRVLEREPDHAQALGMLGLLLSDGPDEAQAEAVLRRHVAVAPGSGASLHALGRLLARQGRDEEAIERLRAGAELLPALAPAHNDLGACLHRAGRLGEALAALERATAIDPAYSVAHANRALVLKESGRFRDALAAYQTALAFARPDQGDLRAAILVQFAQAARTAGWTENAESLLQNEWRLRPEHADIGGELALLLEHANKAEAAREVRNDLARRAGLHRAGATHAGAPTLLVLGAVGCGHTPTRYLVDDQVFTTLSLTLLSPDQPDAPLGAIDIAAVEDADLVFSTLGDVDHDGGQFEAAGALLARLGKPVLNPPASIGRTGRNQAMALFAGIDGMITPPVSRATPQTLKTQPIERPTLVRPAGDHGGANLTLLSHNADRDAYLDSAPPDRLLICPFVDYRSPDGHWRKYRLIFVDREVFPYHLAIGDGWLTHYWRAEMSRAEWKMAEEERFLADWRGVFGPRAAAAAQTAAERLDLDYGGMDCALTASGELLLFEANASMLLHLDEPKARFGYKHRYVPPIREAFTRMALKRAGLEI